MTYQPTDKKFSIPSLLGLSLHRVYISVRVKTVSKQVERKCNSNNKIFAKYEPVYLSNEMKCCVKFQTAINSSRKMKHGNFRASKAADMYFN